MRRLLGGVLAIAMALALLVFGVNRVTSPRVQVRTIPVSGPDHGPRDALRVVAYNIAHSRALAPSNWATDHPRENLAAIGALLRVVDADVVALSEVDFSTSWSDYVDASEVLAEVGGYAHVATVTEVDLALPGMHWRYGNALLSRHPLRACTAIEFPPYSWWSWALLGPVRAGLVCVVSAPQGEIVVVSTHFDHRDAAVRVGSAAAVLRHPLVAQARAVVVAGDLNSSRSDLPSGGVPDDPSAVEALMKGGLEPGRAACQAKPWRDRPDTTRARIEHESGRASVIQADTGLPAIPCVAQEARYAKGATFAPTFPTGRPERTIDWILGRGVEIRDTVVLDVPLSDHLPVVADVFITASRAAHQP